MKNNNSSESLITTATHPVFLHKPEEDYSVILELFEAQYQKIDYYLQVGSTQSVQGWILHLSVIGPQIPDLLKILLPILLAKKVVFKIPMNKKIARNILDGNLGYEQLGKVVSIYSDNEQEVVKLAKQLIELTSFFRGPSIPTDLHLGGIVYTRYGSINPIMRHGVNGQMEKYIYATNGELIKDNYPIPFHFPAGINWPFTDMAIPETPKTRKNLRNIYKPMNILKPDARGSVIKALYLKSLFKVGICVIKAGKKNMLADDLGRDMQDRLMWQKKLHQELGNFIRLPKVLDFFEENGEFYLVMEYIKGNSLNDCLIEINKNQRSWFQLSAPEQLIIFDLLLKIINAIKVLHNKGFVHRDIAPGNFIFDTHGDLVLIDVELAYDLKKSEQQMPFELGTPGFMSAEQEAINLPTIKDDIYGLGALMINCFTSLSPLRFNVNNPAFLFQNLNYFIQNAKIAELICSCLHHQPSERPFIQQIESNLETFKKELQFKGTNQQMPLPQSVLPTELLEITIQDALKGLSKKPMPFTKGIWLSRTIKNNNQPANIQKEFSPFGGIHTGMTGVLYLLARAKKMSYELDSNIVGYQQSWNYIFQEYLNNTESMSPSLYNGTAGIALALVEGLDADLLENNEQIQATIQKCLEIPNEQLNLAEGCTGQGLVLLQCDRWLANNVIENLLDHLVAKLLSLQEKDGSWNTPSHLGKNLHMTISWSQGITGLIYFLMLYHSRNENRRVKDAINKSLAYLLKCTKNIQGLFNPSVYKKLLNNQPEIGDERTGVILCCTQAYHFLKDPYFKEMAEQALYQYPDFVVNSNFSQDGGMAALGELYLEAWRIFKNEEWKRRAWQIASVFLHTSYHKNEESNYWIMDETAKATVDLLSGNSGIIHFLLRCSDPEKMRHILLH